MKIEDHIAFTANHKNWKVGDKLLAMDDRQIAHFLAMVSNTVTLKLPEYLTEVMNVAGIMSLAEEMTEKDVWELLKTLKSPGTSRKLNPMIFEENKKLKNHLLNVAKALLTREALSKKVSINYPEGVITELKTTLIYHDEHINFTAKNGSWIVVKRLIIDNKTPMADIARILASINETAVSKIPLYGKIDLDGIRKWFGDIKKARSEAEIKTLVEKFFHIPVENYAPNEFKDHAKIYALRVALEKVGLTIDIPAKPLEKYLEKR
ncbi:MULTISPECIES: DUF2666 family protein [Thermococcus]|uniref:DUF2666 domain-containing protein n=2 Tax=Thermococcus sibiricus TaxID=172049 RepID=C6A0L1_THESM|nr:MULTISPECIES: DUF2666 family protein [Thermococcus]KUK28550.1 MAG: Uncharacterized protein XD61_0899 [Thermococcus sp. 40_45]HII66816.1 DUF2666 domain-containing protein [Thermococcaceae archaeon]ACS89156.1 hypothetical protein TSIB_0088 [Thermococcus sibiricus MM 739]KUK17842.1 MAG: Uncharacterized protein XD54_0859 [Thermococcus sibiricus]MBC7095345.1 DUF2666 family protein [Thermococcus sp.]